MKALPVTILAVVAALAVGGCGGDDSSGSETVSGPDKQEVTDVLNRAFVDGDPADCALIFTEKALDQQIAMETDDLVGECETLTADDKGKSSADSIEVIATEQSGTGATATVAVEGSPLDGAELTVSLVDSDGLRIDEITDVQVDDIRRTIKATAEGVRDEAFLKPGDVKCVAGALSGTLTPASFEKALLKGDPTYLTDALTLCLGGGSDTAALLMIITEQLLDAGAPRDAVECIAVQALGRTDGITLLELQTDPDAQKELDAAGKKALDDCFEK